MIDPITCPKCDLTLDVCGCALCEHCGEFSPEWDKRQAVTRTGHTLDYCTHCAPDVEANAHVSNANGELIL